MLTVSRQEVKSPARPAIPTASPAGSIAMYRWCIEFELIRIVPCYILLNYTCKEANC